jgi:protein-tyrosine phosphatase
VTGLIDIHCHILPGLDDGPKEMEESVAMGRMYAAMGFLAVAATPHCIPGTRWMPGISLIRARAREVGAVLEEEGVALKIYTGMEIALDPLAPILLRQGRLLTLANGPYLLIESPFQQFPLGWEGILAEIRRMGYKVLLAHPERCANLARKPSLVDEIKDAGVYVQVNLDSLAGLNGRHAQKTALLFAQKGCLHCLATDSHDSVHRCPAMVSRTAEAVSAFVSRQDLQLLLKENPERVLRGQDLEAVATEHRVVPVKEGRRKWFW